MKFVIILLELNELRYYYIGIKNKSNSESDKMYIYHPLRMNNWPTKPFLIFVLSVQLSLLGIVSLDIIGLNIPILRQIISLIYLLVIPGTLLLRILKLHKLGTIEILLYTIGLSLMILMFTGFFLNRLSPFLGISTPISLFILISSFSLIILILSIVCYFIDRNFSDIDFIKVSELFSPQVLFLFLMPLITVFGTYLVNYHKNNVILLAVIFLIFLLYIVAGFEKIIPSKLYPLTIWVIAISLIWHVTLISSYVNIGDVVSEYYFASLVIKNSFWDWNIQGNSNSVLTSVILAPIFQIVLNLDLTWIFKIIFPLLYSLTPLAVYRIFIEETKNDKVSLLSSFLYVSILPFFSRIPLIPKQSIAEIFLLALLLSLYDRNINNLVKSIFTIFFSFSLIVSHYSISYIISASLFFTYIVYKVIGSVVQYEEKNKTNGYKNLDLKTNYFGKTMSLNFVLLFTIFTLAWYMHISNSSVFSSVTVIGKNIFHSFYDDFLSPDHSRGLYLIARDETSVLRFINKYYYIVIQCLIVIGFSKKASEYKNLQYSFLYMTLSSFFILILIVAIAVSGFAMMDPQRLFHLSLIVLAPFCIVGWLYIHELRVRKFKVNILNSRKVSLKIFSLFLAVFLLFNVGFVYEIAHDHPTSISISQNSIRNYGDSLDKANFYGADIVEQNVFSGKWLGRKMDDRLYVYRGDLAQGYPSLTIYGGVNQSMIKEFSNSTKETPHGYIQLTYENVVDKIGSTRDNNLQKRSVYSFSDIYTSFEKENTIYDNGGSKILRSM